MFCFGHSMKERVFIYMTDPSDFSTRYFNGGSGRRAVCTSLPSQSYFFVMFCFGHSMKERVFIYMTEPPDFSTRYFNGGSVRRAVCASLPSQSYDSIDIGINRKKSTDRFAIHYFSVTSFAGYVAPPRTIRGGGVIGEWRMTLTARTSNARIRTTNMTIKDFAKNRYIWSLWCQKQVHSKTNYKSHARSPVIGQRHIVPVFGSKRPGTRGFVYCLAFNCFWRILSQSAAIH